MKILITGSTGFLGSHLTKALVNEGHEVLIIKRSYSDTWRIADVLSKVVVFNIDKDSIEQAFKEFGSIDVVIHTATIYDRNGEKASKLLNTNVLFPLKILETAILNNTKMFINTDSFIHKNNLGYEYLQGYALTKKHFLEWGKEFGTSKKIHFINLRLEHIYGPFDSYTKFVPHVTKTCLENDTELNLTSGNQKRDFIHINDVISAYSLLITQKITDLPWFKEYELGTGEAVSVRDFVELIHRKSQSKTVLKFGALPYRENEIMDSKANNEELKKFGWINTISLEQGIEMMLKDEKYRIH